MGFDFASLIGGALGKTVKDIISTFKLDPALKAQLADEVDKREHEIALKGMELQSLVEQHIDEEIKARKDIIVAEMQQDDKFTKRARPMIVYCGLGFIFLNHVLPAIITYFGAPRLEPIVLPEGFWTAWQVVVGVWAVGRTAEKLGHNGGLVSAITGNKPK